MFKKSFFIVIVIIFVAGLVLVGCQATDGGEVKEGDEEKIRVAMVFAVGGLGDKGFNDQAYDGLKKAEEELGIEFDYVEPSSIAELEGYQRRLAQTKKYDIIMMLAHYQADALEKVSAEFPDQKFVIQDTIVEAPNVASYLFKDHEKTFLVGALVGQLLKEDNLPIQGLPNMTGSNITGVIGGEDVPLIRSFISGYMAGVKYVNPDAEVLVSYVGDFGDPVKGKEMALAMYNRGADIVYHACGGSGLGVFEAAKEVDRYSGGVDIDQTVIDPEHIIFSSIRKMDTLIYDIIKNFKDTGTFEAGAYYPGIQEDSVGYVISEVIDVEPAIIDKVEELREKIRRNELVIPDKIEDVDAFLEANKE